MPVARGIEAGRLVVALGIGVLAAGCNPDDSRVLLPTGAPGAGSGSSGGSGGMPGSCGNKGRPFFEENVLPILDDGMTGDMCARCHSAAYQDNYGGPDFLGSSKAETYDKLVGDVAFVSANSGDSALLNQGSHTGPAFSPSQQAEVKEWLGIEAAERSGDCTALPSGKPCSEALAEFGACMTLDDWTASGMSMIATQNTLNDGPCFSCHQSGTGGNPMTDPFSDASIAEGFEKMRVPPALLKLVACSSSAETGAFEDIKQSYRWRDKGGQGDHPKFILSDGNLAALDEWFDLVHAKWESGPCSAP
jgi:hypothetical protein